MVILSVVTALCSLLYGTPTGADQQKTPVLPTKIIRLDPRFDQLVPANAVVEVVADGFAWIEGPVWNRMKNAHLFSDIPNNAVMQWKEGNSISQFLKPSRYSGSTPFTGREPGPTD
jgi:gluconolactonase